MKIIAHRANLNGPNSRYENQISSINNCLDLGYDVEIDVRLLDSKLYLGHDEPNVIITEKDLRKIKKKVWIHCKNLDAISFFKKLNDEFNYFWHQNDSYTLTSKGYIWAFPGEKLSPECISVMPELNNSLNDIKTLKKINISGICTDYPNLLA